MNKVAKDIFSVALCVISSIGTIKDLTQNQTLCIVVAVISILAVIGALIVYKRNKNRDLCIAIAIGGLILYCTSFWALDQYRTREQRCMAWEKALSKAHENKDNELLEKANNNDGPALYSLAIDFYNKKDFSRAREYARRATDNGNSKAYLLLATLYLEGYGCPQNIHLAIANQINANRYHCIDNEPFLSRLQDLDIELAEKDKRAINQCLKYVDELEGIINDIYHAYEIEGDKGIKTVIEKNNDRLYELSAMGYIPATQLLYEGKRIINPKDNESILPLVEMMYQANTVPTNQRDRFYFMSYLDDYYDYRSSRIDLFIENDVYPSLLTDLPLYNDLTDHDAYLIQNYLISRAQYEYSKSLVNGERELYDLILSNSEKYEVFFERSKSLLVQAIDSVQMVLPTHIQQLN